MKKSRFREEQIFGVLKEAGVPVGKLSRKLGTIDATSYRWRAQARHGGYGEPTSEADGQLEEEWGRADTG